MLKLGNIQEKVINSLTNKISEKYNLDISIDSSELSFEDGIILKDILLNDHFDDTLVYIKNLKTNLKSLEKLVKGDVRFSNLHLDGMILKIKKYPANEVSSLQFFLNSINLKKDTTKVSPIISVSSFKINNSQIRLPNDNNSYKIFKLKLNNIIAGPDFIESGIIDGEFEVSKINSFSVKSNSFKYLGCSFSFDDFSFISDQGNLYGNIEYGSSSGNFFDYFEKPKINSKIRILDFKPSKLNVNIDSNLNISGELELMGSLDSINIKNVYLDFGYSKLNAEIDILNFFSKKENLFSGFIKIDTLSLNDLNSIIKKPEPLLELFKNEKINKFDLSGDYSNKKWNLITNIESTFGVFKSSLINKKSNSIFINIKELNLSKISKLNFDGFASANLNLNLKNDLVDWKIEEGYLSQKNTNAIKFNAKGSGDFKKGNISWSTLGRVEVLLSELEYDFSPEINKLSSVINLKSYDLSNINNQIGGGKAILSGIFKSKIEGRSIDDASIILTVQDLSLIHKKGVLNSADFYLNSFNKDGFRNFSIINSSWLSGEAIGRFDLSKTKLLINNALSETFPIIPKSKLSKVQEVKFDFTLSKDLVNILNTDIQSTEDFNLIGYLSSDENKSYLDIEVPFFQYQDFFAQGLKINLNNKLSSRASKLIIDKAIYKNSNLGEFILGSKINQNKLSINVSLNSAIYGGDGFDFNFDIDKLNKNKSIFYLTESSISFNNKNWKLKEFENEPIIFDYSDGSYEIKNFKISSGTSLFKVKGFYKGSDEFDVNLDIKNSNFNQFFKQNENFKFNGLFNSSLELRRSQTDNSFKGFIKSPEVIINKVLVGKFDFNVMGNTLSNSYSIDWSLIKNDNKTFSGIGNLIYDKSLSKLDLDISFSKFDISFSSPLGKNSISNIRGNLDGDLNIWGNLNNLQNTGLINLDNAHFSLPYLNVDYTLSNNSKVNFVNNVLNFLPTEIHDNIFKTKAKFESKFDHSNFKDWNIDLSVQSEKLLLLNKKETSESLFYGQGFLSGDISLLGPIKNLQLKVNGLTAPGTSIKIPLKDTQEISDISFIKFIDKNNKIKVNKINEFSKPLINQITGLEMEFKMDINNDAIVEIVVDQSSGSYLNGRGYGNLRMEINTKGKFNMWGDFTTTNGIYNFKNLGLLDKKFNLKPGGTIVWDGNPLGAQMNLNALYEVPGGANPAILLDNPNFNKKIPTELGINLQGDLLKPDNPIFEIFFPNTSGTVVSEINYRLADPQRRQLQAISLLSQGIFINEIGLSVEGITNNLYEKASDIFTSIIGNDDEKLKVGINYLQGDRNADLDIFSEDRLGLTLSTQISDKILINGKIGVPIGGVNETLIVGDVQIDFILNEDGSLKAKVFNKENEFRYIGDKLGYTQGMGISYNVDFNTFRELINKIVKESE